mgnify:CR=1 FL=1
MKVGMDLGCVRQRTDFASPQQYTEFVIEVGQRTDRMLQGETQ